MNAPKFYRVGKEDLRKFLSGLSSGMEVYVPVKAGNDFELRRMEEDTEIDLSGYINTARPPRELLLSEGETLLEYNGSSAREPAASEKRVIFGVRPCDVHAVMVLDRALLGHDHVEGRYEQRRNNTLIFSLRCKKTGDNCFCGSMGTSDADDGFDLMFTEEGDGYHVEAGTEEGLKAIGKSRLFKRTEEAARKPRLRFRKKIETEGLTEAMKRGAKSAIWHDVADRCLSCASCTFSCPTCFCFSLKHEASIGDLTKGKVTREMDYCMLLRFSRVAGDYVFRQHRTERVKQFFYHKLVYGLENEGKYHCVGCGRCITECMAKIDITEEAEKIRRKYGKA